MFGLFLYSYGWYEWEDLQCVSESHEKLRTHYETLYADDAYASNNEEHEVFKKKEKRHFYIAPVKVI